MFKNKVNNAQRPNHYVARVNISSPTTCTACSKSQKHTIYNNDHDNRKNNINIAKQTNKKK